jgi:hypothetical protein
MLLIKFHLSSETNQGQKCLVKGQALSICQLGHLLLVTRLKDLQNGLSSRKTTDLEMIISHLTLVLLSH